MKLSIKMILLITSSIIFFTFPIYFMHLTQVEGNSMSPALKDKQLVVALAIKDIPVVKNNIYIIELPNGLTLFKRIIAEPGDHVYVKKGIIYINNKIQYPTDITFPDTPKIKIPEGYYYCYGDNQEDSIDSKLIGLIPRKQISAPIIFTLPIFN